MRHRRTRILGCILLGGVAGLATASERDASNDESQFESKVRPLFVAHCQRCHGAEKQRGGLRLDTPDGMRSGGETGPAIVPGKPEESLLIEAVRHAGPFKMPPKGKLAEAEVAALVEWVRRGAVWPSAEPRGPARVSRAPPSCWWTTS